MITLNVLKRVFRFRFDRKEATCFAINRRGRQYIITAKHVVDGIGDADVVHLFRDAEWLGVRVALVGTSEGEVDVAVLAPSVPVAVLPKIEVSRGGIMLGQDVYFLGFPYGLYYDTGTLGDKFALPFVKKAILSALGDPNDTRNVFYLDGHNNPGFSGGPVIFEHPFRIRPQVRGSIVKLEYKIAGVVSGFKPWPQPVYASSKRTRYFAKENTGIMKCYGIDIATDLIDGNPIGCLVKS